jgi:hypothetical protein
VSERARTCVLTFIISINYINISNKNKDNKLGGKLCSYQALEAPQIERLTTTLVILVQQHTTTTTTTTTAQAIVTQIKITKSAGRLDSNNALTRRLPPKSMNRVYCDGSEISCISIAFTIVTAVPRQKENKKKM